MKFEIHLSSDRELKKLIKLEATTFDIFDMPPAEEHQMYIRNISTHVAQKFVQTGEDNLDEEVQTEDIDVDDRWTQHPPEGIEVCGVGESSSSSSNPTTSTAIFSSAAANAKQFVNQLGRAMEDDDAEYGRNASSRKAASYDVLTLGKFLDSASALVNQLIEEENQMRDIGAGPGGVKGGALVAQVSHSKLLNPN